MSNMESFRNKVTGTGKADPRDALIGLKGGNTESENTESENSTADVGEDNSQGGNKTFDYTSIAASFATGETVKVPKKLKGIYLDEDVLHVYEEQQKKKERGWGSQLVSDLLRAVFENEGLIEKRK